MFTNFIALGFTVLLLAIAVMVAFEIAGERSEPYGCDY